MMLMMIPSHASADDRGDVGENCRSRSDCREGLKCISFTCARDSSQTPATPISPEPLGFQLVGTHFFAGADVLLALAYRGTTTSTDSSWADAIHAGFLFGLHGGVLLGHHEIKIELSPFTYFHDFTSPGPSFQVVASYGYLLPLRERGSIHVFLPLRVGAGMYAGGNNTGGNVYFQGMADIAGLELGVGRFLIDIRAPQFRYGLSSEAIPIAPFSSATQEGLLHSPTFLFGVQASYVF
jgi:hypothetical protein